VVHGGQKTNIIPGVVDLDVDIRTTPGTTMADVDLLLREALGELYPLVEISVLQHSDPTASPANTPLWDALHRGAQVAYPGAELVPGLVVGGTDARFYRQHGSVAYGAGLFSSAMDMSTFGERFHGNDERIDVESLGLATDLWLHVAKDLLD
jgi:acetylornithine deacetylase/succinyl-diaminopimelate desuccinylase-like protein